MKSIPFLALILSLVITSCGVKRPQFEPWPAHGGTTWFKGNTHTHTTNSDGDSDPETVARWYKDRGYDFLVLSDHNVLTDPDEAKVGDASFLLIPGEEISAVHRTAMEGAKPIHVNGLNVDRVVPAINDQETLSQTIQANVDAIRAASGVPHINHPNFRWAFSHQEIYEVGNVNLLEIYNGHPFVNNAGNDDIPGMEEVWDILLSKGKRIYGIGTDDAHHFKEEFAPDRSNPGRAWVMVKADALNTDEIMSRIENGDFYFTTGVVLEDVLVSPDEYIVRNPADQEYYTEFIGRNGDVLHSTTDPEAVYTLTGEEMYVRAKVNAADGSAAWTQPVFVDPR